MVSRVINFQYQLYQLPRGQTVLSAPADSSYTGQYSASGSGKNSSFIPQSLRFDIVDNQRDTSQATSSDVPQYAADMPKTLRMTDEVYGNNFDGMKSIIMERISLANTSAYDNDPIAKTRLLLGAYKDIQSFIDSMEKDSGEKPSPQIKSFIGVLKGLKANVLAMIKAATKVDLSDAELEALLDNDPKIKQKKSGKDSPGNNQDLKTKALLTSAGQKLAKQIQGLSRKAAQMLDQVETNPSNAPSLVFGAMILLRQGLQLTMLGGALDAMGNKTQAQGGEANYVQEKQNLMTLIEKATQISKSHGLNAEEMITTTEFANRQAA